MSHICERISQTSRSICARCATSSTRRPKLDAKIDGLKDTISRAQVRAVLLYVALAGSMLGVMAHGFGWL
jgi:hypothetical protein